MMDIEIGHIYEGGVPGANTIGYLDALRYDTLMYAKSDETLLRALLKRMPGDHTYKAVTGYEYLSHTVYDKYAVMCRADGACDLWRLYNDDYEFVVRVNASDHCDFKRPVVTPLYRNDGVNLGKVYAMIEDMRPGKSPYAEPSGEGAVLVDAEGHKVFETTFIQQIYSIDSDRWLAICGEGIVDLDTLEMPVRTTHACTRASIAFLGNGLVRLSDGKRLNVVKWTRDIDQPRHVIPTADFTKGFISYANSEGFVFEVEQERGILDNEGFLVDMEDDPA